MYECLGYREGAGKKFSLPWWASAAAVCGAAGGQARPPRSDFTPTSDSRVMPDQDAGGMAEWKVLILGCAECGTIPAEAGGG